MTNNQIIGLKNGSRVAVIGSRTFENKELLFNKLNKNVSRISMIVSGGADGADSFADEWAKSVGMPILTFYPNWYPNGVFYKGAGFARNALIVKNSDIILAFWDEKSRGTGNSIDIAIKLKKKIYVHNFETGKEFSI